MVQGGCVIPAFVIYAHSYSVCAKGPANIPVQQINSFVVIFASVKKIRVISPFISLLLIILVLSGGFGFTLIHHSCFHCGTSETFAAIAGVEADGSCHCHHGEDHDIAGGVNSQVTCEGCSTGTGGNMPHSHGAHEFTLTDDCCSHEAERVVTDELLRTGTQTEIVPYFLAATVIAVIEEAPVTEYIRFAGDGPIKDGRGLTRLLCRLQS